MQESRYQQSLAAFENEKREAQENNTAFTNMPPGRPWKPAELYNGMIAPLVRLTPSKAPSGIRAKATPAAPNAPSNITRSFPGLIRDWRSLWGEGDFPFLLVQLAPFMDIQHAAGSERLGVVARGPT